jgi:energy-coupling factor transporter ATP-binding protein EcfA2
MRGSWLIRETLHHEELKRAVSHASSTAQRGHGEIVFVAGRSGSGRTHFLRTLAAALGNESELAHVFGGGIRNGEFESWSTSATGVEAGELVEGALGLGGALGLPVAGLLREIVSASRTAADVVRQSSPSEAPDVLARLGQILRASAPDGPVVCVIDDADTAGGRWWSNLLLSLGPQIAVDQPLCLFLTVEGSGTAGSHETGESDFRFAARELIEKGEAQWWLLPEATAEDLGALTGESLPDVRAHLAEMTEGRVGWAADLWAEWKSTGTVERDTDLDPWRFAPGEPHRSPASLAEWIRGRVDRACGEDNARSSVAWEVLCAGR